MPAPLRHCACSASPRLGGQWHLLLIFTRFPLPKAGKGTSHPTTPHPICRASTASPGGASPSSRVTPCHGSPGMLRGVHRFPHLRPEQLSCTAHLSKPLLSANNKSQPCSSTGSLKGAGCWHPGPPAPAPFSWAAAGLGVHGGTAEVGGTCHSPKRGAHLQLLINKQQQGETSGSGKQGKVLLARLPAQCALSSKGREGRGEESPLHQGCSCQGDQAGGHQPKPARRAGWGTCLEAPTGDVGRCQT